jgi:hypothetical protein
MPIRMNYPVGQQRIPPSVVIQPLTQHFEIVHRFTERLLNPPDRYILNTLHITNEILGGIPIIGINPAASIACRDQSLI